MNYKARVLKERPKATLSSRHIGSDIVFAVVDGTDALDDFGHINRGPAGAWRDAYYFLIRQRQANLAKGRS